MGKKEPIIAEKVFPYSKEHDYGGFKIVRIYGSELDKVGGRNKWVKIMNKAAPTSPAIYRIAKGLKGITGFNEKSIQIDYDSRETLKIDSQLKKDDGYYAASLKIENANPIAVFVSLWFTKDPTFRIPLQISLVSLLLGIIALIVSFSK